MMTDPSALPKYQQTAELLIRDIAAGRLADGERLPPERDMAASLGQSVGTLRKALADLEEKGLLERIHGSGNYVRHKPGASGIYAFFRLERPEGGGLPTADLLALDRRATPDGAEALGFAAESHRIRRLRRLNEDPVAVEEIWLDGARADGLRKQDLSESVYLFYRQSLGIWIARAEDRVGIGVVPGWVPDNFGLAAGTPCGHVERIARDQDGTPVEYSRTWFDPVRARYVARLK